MGQQGMGLAGIVVAGVGALWGLSVMASALDVSQGRRWRRKNKIHNHFPNIRRRLLR